MRTVYEVFALSISALSLLQAGLIALPKGVGTSRALEFARSRWWALVMPASIIVVIGAIAAAPSVADGLTYLALVAVPPLAAVALAGLVRGGRPPFALAVVPLFVIAWAEHTNLAGELSAYALTALGCVTLGTLLVAVVPRVWVRVGIYTMAAIDVVFVATDLLQHPNSVLQHAAPAAGLPQLQAVVVGSAAMGFGDLFIAATLGSLLAAERRPRRHAVAIAAVLALLFNLLFFAVDELPTTVPIAATLFLLDWSRRSRPVSAAAGAPAPVEGA